MLDPSRNGSSVANSIAALDQLAANPRRRTVSSFHDLTLAGVKAWQRGTIAIALAVALLIILAPSTFARHPVKSPSPGTWITLGTADRLSRAAMLHMANGHDLVAWQVHPGIKQTFDIADLAQNGRVAVGARDLLGGKDWSGVSADAALLFSGGRPLIVFSGQGSGKYSLGCIVGAIRSGSAWTLQSWSLSAGCTFANTAFWGGAAASSSGKSAVLSADFGGGALSYRIGAAPSIPATTPDRSIKTSGDVEAVSEVHAFAGPDFYGGWYQFFSHKPAYDGIYLVDLEKGASSLRKAPGTGTSTVGQAPQPLAMASPIGSTHVYAAYCQLTNPCNHILLWQYGAKKALSVPGSANSTSAVALARGPSGRLWLAWYDKLTARIDTVRTNKADTAFGPAESFNGPAGCDGDSLATVAANSEGAPRLQIVVVCYDFNNGKTLARATQSLTGLSLAASTPSISHKKGGSVTYRVSDAGDSVAGATVKVDGKTGTTNQKGQITFKFQKGVKVGRFRVTATLANYYAAAVSLVVK
jgi:hypothetical protein